VEHPTKFFDMPRFVRYSESVNFRHGPSMRCVDVSPCRDPFRRPRAKAHRTYRQVLVQEYTFSPAGATFQREEQHLNLPPLTHLRLTIVPDKHGSGPAKLNSLRLVSPESRGDI
jgi:hypothetical protein